MDFPKVYFFGSLRNSLSPIPENQKIAAIFCLISKKWSRKCTFCCRRASRSEGRRPDRHKGRRPVLSQSICKRSFTKQSIYNVILSYTICSSYFVVDREKDSFTWARRAHGRFLAFRKTLLHFIVSFYNNPGSIHVFDVDKNGGKIWVFWFLKKVLKMDFPKVYFFGSLRKSLLPIIENPYFAAIFGSPGKCIFVGISNCIFCSRVALREGPKARPPQGPKARSLTINLQCYLIIYHL